MSVVIHLQDKRWKKEFFPYCKRIKLIVQAFSVKFGNIAIVLADDNFIRSLNKQFRGYDKATNVLSFPNSEHKSGDVSGDVILAYETIKRESLEQGKDFKEHATHLLAHGLLHLLGYDHQKANQAKIMENEEIKILAKLGIKNPY